MKQPNNVPKKSLARLCAEFLLLEAEIEEATVRQEAALEVYNTAVNNLSWIESIAHALRITLAGAVMIADIRKARYLSLDSELAELNRRLVINRAAQQFAVRDMEFNDQVHCIAQAKEEAAELLSIMH